MKRTIATLIVLLVTTTVSAQWIALPTPGVPRTADGEADLSAPAPRLADGHPDLTGLYRLSQSRSDLSNPENLQPWVRSLQEEHMRRYMADHPRYHCLPNGPNNLNNRGNSYGLHRVHHPHMMVMLYNDGTFREIFIDGRELEEPPLLTTYGGYSVGRWEGDTLVVEATATTTRPGWATASHTPISCV